MRLFQHLNEDLNANDKRKHIRNAHFLSNKIPTDYTEEIKRLRENIFSEAMALGNWGDKLPTRWVVLEIEMYRKKDEHVMKYTKAKELATVCSFPGVAQTTSELDSFLKYEHDIGNIIFFKDVNSFIVLDPEWLANVFTCFVSDQYRAELKYMPDWTILETTGILKENLMNEFLKNFRSLTSTENKEYVLKLMEKFDMIVRPMNNDANNEFFMPCMIKEISFQNIFTQYSETEDWKKSSWFCLVFTCLPPSYYNHILTSFVKSNKLFCGKKEKKNDYLSEFWNIST